MQLNLLIIFLYLQTKYFILITSYMKKLFLVLGILGIIAIGCTMGEVDNDSSNDQTEVPNGNDTPENIFFGLDKESVTISPDGGSVDVVVYSNYKWEISGTSDWCTPSIINGDANEDGQKVTFSADVTDDYREATFWFRCADEKIKFIVSQEEKKVIIPDANNSFNIPAEGGIAILKYQTNIDCEVIIPAEAKSWITIVPATRGLVSKSINLDIAENITCDTRSAVVKVVAKDNSELVVEYTINQEQNNALLAEENTIFTVPSTGGEVVIQYQTNIDCEVIIPEEAKSWITIVPATRGLVSESVTLDIAENITYDPRNAVIKVVAKDNAELVVEYTINQEQKNSILADGNNTFTVPSTGGEVEINYQTNVDCEVVIPEEAKSWITIVPATRGLATYSTTLNIAANYSGKLRSSVVKVISLDHSELFAEYTITQNLKYCICYTSRYGNTITPNKISSLDATIRSNTYKNGVGIIEFNAPITTIGNQAFYNCSDLTSIIIPDTVTEIGSVAFRGCSSLTSVTIPNSVTTIGSDAFLGCRSLTSVTIGNSVTAIENFTFYGCTSLTNITIPNSVTTIGNDVFNGCSSLTNIAIPNSVTTIGNDVFRNCSSLKSATIGNRVTRIGNWVFGSCSSLTNIIIPDSVTTIGNYAFCGCSNLASVNIGNGVTTIGQSAFNGCESLTSITIPDSLTSIGNFAFSYCYTLTSITIPDSVTAIGYKVLIGCFNLTSVYCKPKTPPVASIIDSSWEAFNNNASSRKIYVPTSSVEAYKSASGWSDYADYIVGYDF